MLGKDLKDSDSFGFLSIGSHVRVSANSFCLVVCWLIFFQNSQEIVGNKDEQSVCQYIYQYTQHIYHFCRMYSLRSPFPFL